jgi:hypothetical protein
MFFAYGWDMNQGQGHGQMGKSFEMLREAVLRTDRAKVLRDVHPTDEASASEGRWLLIVSTKYDLSRSFRREDGTYEYAFKSHGWKDGADILAELLGDPADLQYDPLYIGIFDWDGGRLSRQQLMPAMRQDMAFAVVLGADPVRDRAALEALFVSDSFAGSTVSVMRTDDDGQTTFERDEAFEQGFLQSMKEPVCPVILLTTP